MHRMQEQTPRIKTILKLHAMAHGTVPLQESVLEYRNCVFHAPSGTFKMALLVCFYKKFACSF
jgi:hypothetical protein